MKKIWTIVCVALLFAGCAYDDDDLWKSIDDIEKQLKELQEKVDGMNDDITSIQSIVEALNKGKTVTGVTESANGYTITFSDNTSISVMSGEAGNNLPVIGVKEEAGIYYWTITKNGVTEWLTDAGGNKFQVAGITPKMGVDSDGFWTINTGNGPVQVTDKDGNPIKAAGEKGDSFFQSVKQSDTEVIFTLTDGTEIVIPKTASLNLVINGAKQQYFYFEESRELQVELSGHAEITISKPDGWRVKMEESTLSITAPAESNPYAETVGEIAVIAIGDATAIAKISVSASAYQLPLVLTFEAVPVENLAGPTAYGENLYSSYGNGYFSSYTDPTTHLTLSIPYDFGMQYYDGFSMGGTAVSRWNDILTESYQNQTSAYYSDAVTGKGGNNGSETFSIVFAPTFMGPGYPIYIEFENKEENIIDHLYISNATYAALSMKNGDGFAKQFNYADKDYFVLTCHGLDASGNEIGTVDYYLADFRTTDAPGILLGWNKVELSSLGKVNRVVFTVKSSDGVGSFMNTPAYFCIDDIAIRP